MIVIAKNAEDAERLFARMIEQGCEKAVRKVLREGKSSSGSTAAPIASKKSFSFREASSISGLSESTLRRQARAGNIRVTKVGSRSIIAEEELHRFLHQGSKSHAEEQR